MPSEETVGIMNDKETWTGSRVLIDVHAIAARTVSHVRRIYRLFVVGMTFTPIAKYTFTRIVNEFVFESRSARPSESLTVSES